MKRILTPFCDVLLQKFDALDGNGFGRRFDVAPDRRGRAQVAHGKSETFNREPTVVLQSAKRLKYAGPLDVAAPRYAAIVLTRVDMLQVLSDSQVAGGDVLLLDVRVKGIEQNSHVR